jgi:hypothetical protein
MHASSSGIESVFSPSRRKILAADRYHVTKQGFRVVFLQIAMPARDQPDVLDPMREELEAVRWRLLTVLWDVPNEERKERPIQTKSEIWPRKSRWRCEDAKDRWIYAIIFALLAACCAITLFFALQAPFRLRAKDQGCIGEFRGEIAALPIETGAISDFRSHGSHRVGGNNREVVTSSFADSGQKTRRPREQLVQRKPARVRIQSAEFSRRN